MHRHKRKIRNRSRFLMFDMLRMTILVPLTILFITRLNGTGLKEAFITSAQQLAVGGKAFYVWTILIAVNLIIFLYIKPVLHFNRSCRRQCVPDSMMRKKAALVYNGLSRLILIVSVLAFLAGGIIDSIGQLKLSDSQIPVLYIILESLSSGFFAGMVMFINSENLLFPAKKIVFGQDCDVTQKYSSFYRKLIFLMTAVVVFLFFQIFDSLTSFYLLGPQDNSIVPWRNNLPGGADLFQMSHIHKSLQELLKVLFVKTLLIGVYVFHVLRELKKMFNNPLDTVRSKLEGLNSDNPELSQQIDIINNDEYTSIYREINQLIEKQNTLLKSSEEKLEKIVESAADPIISFHRDGSIHLFNPAAESFFGYSEKEAAGMNMIDLIDLPDSVRKECHRDASAFIDYITERENNIKRFKGVHRDGRKIPFESNVSITESGHGPHYTAILRDVAGQVEFEETLQKARQNAENANRMKSEFLANMSHELRTPLNAVLGFTQLLSTDKNLTGGQLDKINTISRSGEHLLALINDILDISKIESGKTEMHETVFDLNRFVEDLKDMFILKCKSKGITFYVEYAGEIPPYVIGDLGKLRQIMINLIGNAVKFTSEGGISLLVGEDNGKIRFSVNDTGKGIPGEEIEKILQPFMQSSNVDHEGGTGLGLAISNSFVSLLGGTLEINSEEGRGSTFSFTIPLAVSREAPVVEESKGRVISIKGDRAVKALIVDDKVNNRLILKTMLENVGFVTMEAANGQEAVERTDEFDPAIIFMDIKMPVMDGYEAVEKLKATEKGKAAKIFALTASAFRHDEKKIFESGFDGFLPKPFKLESLFRIIDDNTDIQFNYETDLPVERDKVPDPAELEFPKIASLITDEELDQLDGDVLINDFAAVRELAGSLAGREGLVDLASVLVRFSDNFSDTRLEELVEEIRKGKNG